MAEVGVLQQGHVAHDVAGDADLADLLQRVPVLPHCHGHQLGHVAVVVGRHGDGQPSQHHVRLHLQPA